MSSCNFEGNRVVIDESGLDERARTLVEFAADLVTPFNGTNPARPNAEGVIERPIAQDVSPAYLQKLAELASGRLVAV
jgi:hypothetical protein